MGSGGCSVRDIVRVKCKSVKSGGGGHQAGDNWAMCAHTVSGLTPDVRSGLSPNPASTQKKVYVSARAKWRMQHSPGLTANTMQTLLLPHCHRAGTDPTV